MIRAALTIAALTAALLPLACSSGDGVNGPRATTGEEQAADEERLTREASSGGVDVVVTWLVSEDELEEDLAGFPLERFLLLEVGLDTHSGDLGSIDIVQAARLTAGGDTLAPEEWVASSDDAHHRSGVLVFAREALAGPVTFSLDLGTSSVEFGWDEAPG